MTREQALRRVKRLLGDEGRVRVGSSISSPEKRDAAIAAAETLGERLLAHSAYRFKILRQERGSWMAFVVGQGDTWEEAFAELAQSSYVSPAVRARAGAMVRRAS